MSICRNFILISKSLIAYINPTNNLLKSSSMTYAWKGYTVARPSCSGSTLASLEQMRDTSGPSNTEGATSHVAASMAPTVAPTAETAVDEEAEEAAAELEDGEETSGADASTEEAATQAAPWHAIRYSYCWVEVLLSIWSFK
jgi:hypothetical protein